jgi:hypothetical protein
VALVVLLRYRWAPVFDHGHFKPGEILGGRIPTNVLAQAPFCGGAPFLMGRTRSVLPDKTGQ